jgi:hypothetical protein
MNATGSIGQTVPANEGMRQLDHRMLPPAGFLLIRAG